MSSFLSKAITCTIGALSSIATISLTHIDQTAKCEATSVNMSKKEAIYTLQDVSNHNSDETGYWVSFGDGVYDVTNFINIHQAGKYYIKMASGGRLEPFWNIFRNHLTEIRVPSAMQPLRIGTLAPKDQIIMPDINQLGEDEQLINEPIREDQHNLHIFGEMPYYCEPKAPLFGESFLTPNQLFFVRNHFPVPTDTAMEHELHIHLSGFVFSLSFSFFVIHDIMFILCPSYLTNQSCYSGFGVTIY